MSLSNRSQVLLDYQSPLQNLPQKTNMKNYQAGDIKTMLDSAKSAQIVIPQTSIDSIGAGLALALGLKKKGLDVSVFTTSPTDNNYSKLSGLELLTTELKKNDLTITIEHPVDQIERVSYNDDGGKLNLIVQTKTTSPQIQNDKIFINNGGVMADISFILGDDSTLGTNADIVSKGNWVVISDKQINPAWAKAVIVDPSAPFSEIFSFLLPMIGLEIDMDMGKNLLIGLRVATQSFSVNVSPESFEAGALCLKATQPVPGQPDPLASTPLSAVENKSIPGTNQPNPVSSV